MTDTLIFNGHEALNFEYIRANVIRIPEVVARLVEAQLIWDKAEGPQFNFFHFLSSEDNLFLKDIKYKTLAASVVQLGLFDRYVKRFNKPQFLLGNGSGDAVINVASGKKSLEELILSSLAINSETTTEELATESFTNVLVGFKLAEYAIYRWDSEQKEFGILDTENRTLKSVVQELIEDHRVKKVINIGPGSYLFNEVQNDFALYDLQCLESIDVDPMLTWFWQGIANAEQRWAV